jgi:hypothetical protein
MNVKDHEIKDSSTSLRVESFWKNLKYRGVFFTLPSFNYLIEGSAIYIYDMSKKKKVLSHDFTI